MNILNKILRSEYNPHGRGFGNDTKYTKATYDVRGSLFWGAFVCRCLGVPRASG